MTQDEYFKTKEFRSILRDYEECQRQGVPCIISSDDYTDLAEYYHQQKGDLEKAEQCIDTAISLYPGAASPLVFKARLCLMKQADSTEARHWAEQIEDKNDPDYSYIIAEILIAENRIEEADDCLHQCYDGMDDEDEKEDFAFDAASLFSDYDVMDCAEQWLELVEDTDEDDYHELMARILISKGRHDEGEKMLNTLLDSNPFVGPYWNSLALSQFQRSNFRESIASSEFSIALNPNDEEAVLNKANGLYQLGNYEEAAQYYERYNKLRPNEESGELFLGICLICLNRLTEAEEHLKKAEKRAMQTGNYLYEIYQELSFVESRLGRTDEALAYVDLADTMDCDHEEMMVLRAHIYLENGYVDKAQKWFMKAIKHSNASPHIFLRVAVSIYDNGYLPLAQRMFDLLLNSVDDDWTDGYSYMAACAYEHQDRKNWLLYLHMATEKNPTEAKNVLQDYFPEGMDPEEYYRYAEENDI